MINSPTREVYLADTKEWLKTQQNLKIIITSLPDLQEVDLDLE